jgi:hypothetical protein
MAESANVKINTTFFRVFAPFGQCVGAADVARPPVDIRPPEVGAGDGGKGLDGSTGGLEKFPA